ncbi:ribosome maturation factor RimM [Limobrevibacterium gyesilva]|uniref:Ribosome maturation factor RimM n=1 Tax=Limobrevibacterium gyesilva TaxID=2991712 RepID=A0AA41YSX3_9PROT|nr:ribosome maturation factor RimM [Limobrevibacterium gyesilva]MCW3474867.1 ribosome maturation factor RimM [Limobrevibacterium gyesilva]
MGVIGRPHGVRGLVHVHSYTADPADLPAYGPFFDERGRRFTLRWQGEGVARLSELVDGKPVPVNDRGAAERLVNTRLYVDRDRLPPPEEEEFYLADLVGLDAVGPDGTALGRVEAVHDYGAGASLEIGRLIVPFTRACVPVVDIAAGRITVVPPEEVVVPAPAEASAEAVR